MANCKFCGKSVKCAEVHHTACREKAAEELCAVFCDEYCRWPFVCKDEDELQELHCDQCPMPRLLNLGL